MIFNFKDTSAKALQAVKKVDGTEVLKTSILEHALTLGRGVYEYYLGGSSYTGNDLPHGNYAYGNATIYKREANYITVVLWGLNGVNDTTATNTYRSSAWTGWRINATTADLAKYLPKTGGYLSGNLTVQKTDASEARYTVQNSLRTASLLANGSGELGLYDNALGWIFKSLSSGNTFNGTASGNLPLTGGRINGTGYFPLEVNGTSSNNENYIKFLSNGTVLGSLGFYGVYKPRFVATDGVAYMLLHTGNSAKVVISQTAPSDTAALWVY